MTRRNRTFSTFKPRGESRQNFVERVHGEVLAGQTIRDLWLTYYKNRFEARADRPLEPEMIALLQEVFYSGVVSMFHLMNEATMVGDAPEDIERGAAQLSRLYEELETYTRGLK